MNPWIGLRPFEVSEQPLFFGREREVKVLLSLVATLPVLIVYAPSGTGKSSLLNAGLMPEIEKDPAQVLVTIGTHEDVTAATRAALRDAGWEGSVELGLADMLHQHWLDTDRRALIVIDQFEERLNAAVPTDDLFSAIAKATHSGTDAVCFILSLREDYLGGLEPLMRRVPGLMNGSFRVPSLSRQALEEAVYGPLAHAGGEIVVEDSLVARVLDDLDRESFRKQEPGEQRFEPGYFQIIWSRLWEENARAGGGALTAATYTALGEAAQILKDFTSGILAGLEPAQAHLFWAISRYLVLPTGAKVALTVEDLAFLVRPSDFLTAGPAESPRPNQTPWLSTLPADQLAGLIRTVLQELTSSRSALFQRVVRADREEFELLHDLLGGILLAWRIEYETSFQATIARRAMAVAERGQLEVQRTAGGPSGISRAGVRKFSATAQRTLREFEAQLEQCSASGDATTTHDAAQLMKTADALLAVTSVFDFHYRYASYKRWGDLPYRWDATRQEVTPAIFRAALEHPSRELRVQLQELAFLWTGDSDVVIRLPRESRTSRAAAAIGGVALGALSVVLAAWLTAAQMDELGVQYANLTLYFVIVALGVPYVSCLLDRPATLGERLTRATVPAVALWDQPGSRILGIALTWPLPGVWMQTLALAGAYLFTSLDAAPTAGYNVGMLIGGLGVVALLTITVLE